jgi:hypothetical protein
MIGNSQALMAPLRNVRRQRPLAHPQTPLLAMPPLRAGRAGVAARCHLHAVLYGGWGGDEDGNLDPGLQFRGQRVSAAYGGRMGEGGAGRVERQTVSLGTRSATVRRTTTVTNTATM